jgi:hypothetical protein
MSDREKQLVKVVQRNPRPLSPIYKSVARAICDECGLERTEARESMIAEIIYHHFLPRPEAPSEKY